MSMMEQLGVTAAPQVESSQVGSKMHV